jgi:hypothetical protein
MAPHGNHRGNRMWPSLETANQINGWASVALIVSLALGVACTIAIVWTAGVRETYWDEARRQSAEKIAALVTQGGEFRKETAEATARTKEAESALEKLKAPRVLTPQQFATLRDKMAAFKGLYVRIWSLGGSADILPLAMTLHSLFSQAQWKVGTASSLSGKSLTGIFVAPWKNSKGSTAAHELSEYLNSIGLATELGPPMDNDAGLMPAANATFPHGMADVTIAIGSKL